ncbi:Transmembrane amino acid transporter protein, putative [Angomonas deanei]|uniref:Transmembrane amino acid transporter protein, putative n=1 Tax=Angomonas deanei TaxID=59799 RepID=A0A7G2CQ65_9TRYP|nr:Transmembrane amino acid transporter protein, putative [Angomonas deanei]
MSEHSHSTTTTGETLLTCESMQHPSHQPNTSSQPNSNSVETSQRRSSVMEEDRYSGLRPVDVLPESASRRSTLGAQYHSDTTNRFFTARHGDSPEEDDWEHSELSSHPFPRFGENNSHQNNNNNNNSLVRDKTLQTEGSSGGYDPSTQPFATQVYSPPTNSASSNRTGTTSTNSHYGGTHFAELQKKEYANNNNDNNEGDNHNHNNSGVPTIEVPQKNNTNHNNNNHNYNRNHYNHNNSYPSRDSNNTNDSDYNPHNIHHRELPPVDTGAVHSALVIDVAPPSGGDGYGDGTPSGAEDTNPLAKHFASAPFIGDSSSNRQRVGSHSLHEDEEHPFHTSHAYTANPQRVAYHEDTHSSRLPPPQGSSNTVDDSVYVDARATTGPSSPAEEVTSPGREEEEEGGVVMAENEHEGGEPYAITIPSQIEAGRLSEDDLQLARLAIYNDNCTVSSLDFLRDTTDAVLPDEVNTFFNSTSTFYQNSMEFFKTSIPKPVQSAFQLTTKGLAIMAEYTGDVLNNVPERIMDVIPDGLVSKEMQKLVLMDFLSVLKCYLNFEILFTPFIFAKAGLVTGLFLVVGVNLVACYSTYAFFGAKQQLKLASQVVMYDDVPRLTWGHYSPIFTVIYLFVYFVSFVLYAALNGQYLLRRMGLEDKEAATVLSYFLPCLFCLPLVFMKRARTQAPLSSLTSLLVFISAIMIMSLFNFSASIRDSFGQLALWPGDVADFFSAFGFTLFIFSPLRRSVPVERGMHPDRFIKLSFVCTGISTAFYLAFGLTAFLYYKTTTCSVLPLSFANSSVETAVSALLFFTFLFVVPQSLFRIGEICDRRVLGLRRLPGYWQLLPNVMRIAFLVGAAILASTMPHFGILLALGGSFGCGVMTVVIPAALDYVRRERIALRAHRHLRWWEYVTVFGLCVLGVIVVVVGIIMGCYDMWRVSQAGVTTC